MDGETQTPSTSGSNKMWYIIGAIVVVLLLGWLVTRDMGGIAGTMAGVDTDRNMDGSTTYTDDQGNSATVGGGSMPENWPTDAPANFAGASIQYSGTSNPQTGEAGSAIVYTVSASSQAVADHYRAQLQSNGWKLENTANVGGATVLSASKGDRNMGIYITDAGEGKVSVTAGIEL
ncbi:MAG TPA: hypothetical protein VJH91_03040 [Candidatus Paceibacterota bacterium]